MRIGIGNTTGGVALSPLLTATLYPAKRLQHLVEYESMQFLAYLGWLNGNLHVQGQTNDLIQSIKSQFKTSNNARNNAEPKNCSSERERETL